MQGSQPQETLELVNKILNSDRAHSYSDCVKWARLLFQENYNNSIRQLLFNFPPDQKTSSGALFWSGPKRCPHPLEFDPANDTHMSFIIAAANIRAFMYGIPPQTDRSVSIKDDPFSVKSTVLFFLLLRTYTRINMKPIFCFCHFFSY